MAASRQRGRVRTASVAVSDSLVDAALALLEEEGLASLTVRGVAARAKVAPMGVYSRFGSKDGLLEALFVDGFAKLQVFIETPRSRRPVDRLLADCMGYREFAIGNPQLYHLMFEQMLVLELSPEALESAKHSFGTLVDRVQSAMHAGELSTGDATEVAQQIWSAMHGAVSLEIAGVHFAADRERNYTAMIDALLRGLAS
jgi:AcrR family transcriptional regulator